MAKGVPMVRAEEAVIKYGPEFDFAALNAFVDKHCMDLAAKVAARAKASSAFQDYKGTPRESKYSKANYSKAEKSKLRKSIRVKKSKFTDGGAIVYSGAPHAWLVEFGHTLVIDGKVVGKVPAHPYLRPAVDQVMAEAVAIVSSGGAL